MPDLLRDPHRLDCAGIDLVHPYDRMPPGAFPYLSNVRVVQEGRLEARPGYTAFGAAGAPSLLHSIRRLNDVSAIFALAGYTYIVGNGTILEAGIESALVQIDTGYSGNPLSLITFRPQNSPAAWMYVYDANKQVKIRPDGVVQSIGIPPPTASPSTTYGIPEMATITDGESATGWATTGSASAITLTDRTNSSTPTIAAILYDAGTSGWCCINPIASQSFFWAGERMRIHLGGTEQVAVREIHAPIVTTTIQQIAYDAGASGACSLVLTNSPTGLARNSLIKLTAEIVKVQSVSLAQDGISYSVRCSTTGTHAAGETVLGLLSWYCYTVNTHAVAEAITLNSIQVSMSLASGVVSTDISGNVTWESGTPFDVTWPPSTVININGIDFFIISVSSSTSLHAEPILTAYAHVAYSVTLPNLNGGAALLISEDASKSANGRPIDAANDYMHLSLFLQNPQNVSSVELIIDIGAQTTSLATAFKNDFWTWTIPSGAFSPDVPSNTVGDNWIEVLVPISTGIRSGQDLAQNFSNVKAIQVKLITTGPCSFGFDCWYFLGTYGPFVQPNSPVGLLYSSVDRDSTTGAASVPGPATRYELFPLREKILVTPAATALAGVDSLDIYRQGGTLLGFVYVGTVANNIGSPNTFADVQPDATIVGNPAPDLSLLQPWPILRPAWKGTVNVVGTSVYWVSGQHFNVNLLANTVITINGTAYQVYGQPHSATWLEIQSSGGVQIGATYTIGSPTLIGQSLPFAFGPLEGPFAPVIFALGDTNNAGTLYYSNSSNADAASDANSLELCSPSEPLVSGDVWNGFCIVGSHDNIYVVRYSYLTTIGAQTGGPVVYQFLRIPSASGMWARWACVRGPDGVYFLGRDGVYRATDQGTENITDPALYPLFPHDGQPPALTNGLYPVDMTAYTALRMSRGDTDIKFYYTDTAGAARCLRYEFTRKRWFPLSFADAMAVDYLVEEGETSPNSEQILLLGRTTGEIYLAGGNTDAGAVITSAVQTPSYDGGDERGQKLYVDIIHDIDHAGTVLVTPGYNNNTSAGPTLTIAATAARNQYIENISSLANLALWRNINAVYSWTGGPAGPRIYAFEYAGYVQPYVSTFIQTQFIALGWPGWKHHRRLYPGLISNAPVTLTIKTQDGRSYVIVIPSTGGQFRIQPMIVPQGCKDLAFAYQLDGGGVPFALFPESFVIETKGWVQKEYTDLPVLKT